MMLIPRYNIGMLSRCSNIGDYKSIYNQVPNEGIELTNMQGSG